MAENLREVIARRLANSQASKVQTQKPIPTSTPIPSLTQEQKVEVQEEDEEFNDIEDDETLKEVEEKAGEDVSDEEKAQSEMQENAQRIMVLQDNGIFRAELLHQLNEIKRALTILASIGVELTKPNEN